jgi:Flp pilus assembly protein TadB
VGTVATVGTLLWLAGAVVLALAWIIAGRPLDVWFTTCVAGAVIGGFGYSVYRWQRAAARRGSRTAQRGLD